MKLKNTVNTKLLKAVTSTAVKSSERAANSSCILWQYQPKETAIVKKLRKF